MIYHYVNEAYTIFNVSSKLTAYGYIYYASLSAGESYAAVHLFNLISIIGIGATVFLLVMHLSAIIFASKHLYKTVHIRDNQTHSDFQSQATPKSQTRSLWSKTVLQASRCFSPMFHKPNLTFCCYKSRKTSLPNNITLHSSNSSSSTTVIRIPVSLPHDSTPTAPKPVSYPGVSIIKPLAGVDSNLEVNLVSYFNLDYPTYEILFCVADQDDPSCNVVRRLQSRYPGVSSRLVVAKRAVGVNPKVNNMQAGYEASQYELLLVSDSGVWMRPDTLTDMVASLSSNAQIGLVHQLPFMTPFSHHSTMFSNLHRLSISDCLQQAHLTNSTSSVQPKQPPFAWIVQLLFFGCWHAKIYLCAAYFGVNCTTGMSCLMRKSVLTAVDGFCSFGRYLAEDFFLAKYYLDHGWKIKISHQPAWQNSPAPSLLRFASRLSRWAHLRLSMVTLAFILEPFTRCFPMAIFSSVSFAYLLPDSIDPGVYFLCYVLAWFLMDYILLLCVYPPCVKLGITKVEFLIAWIFSELVAVPLQLCAVLQKEVNWRERRFRVHWGGVSELLVPSVKRLESKLEDSCSVKCLVDVTLSAELTDV